MNDGNQSGDRSDQDLYNDYDPETAELPVIDSQTESIDLSSVPDAPDGYGLPKQVDAITPDEAFAPSTSGIEEFTQYDDGTYFDDIEHVTEPQVAALDPLDEFEFGSDDNADDQHVRFIDERPQGAVNGRVLAVIGAVGFVLIASLIVGYALSRGGSDDGGNEIVAADGSDEDEDKLASESGTTVAQTVSSDGGALDPIGEEPGASVEEPADPASPVTVASPQETTKGGVSVPFVTTKPTTASSGVTTKPSTVTTVNDPVTTVDTPVTTVDSSTTTIEDEPTTTVEVATVAVPNVVGLTAQEAQGLIEDADLVFKTKLVKNALDADGEPLPNNYVISSSPGAGVEVEEGSTVEVSVNRVVPVTPLAAAGQAVNP